MEGFLISWRKSLTSLRHSTRNTFALKVSSCVSIVSRSSFSIESRYYASRICSEYTKIISTSFIPLLPNDLSSRCLLFGDLVPGERKFGLELMDIYHARFSHGHIDNISGVIRTKRRHFGVKMKKGRRGHLKHMTRKGFHSTRIVLDAISVLSNADKAQKRGWTNWNRQCERAQQALEASLPVSKLINERKSAKSAPITSYPKVGRHDAPKAYLHSWEWPAATWKYILEQILTWSSSSAWGGTRRKDRWPPSKHLYYERFRGTTTEYLSGDTWVRYFTPDADSMDQRGGMWKCSYIVVPCDEIKDKDLPLMKGGCWDRIKGKGHKIYMSGTVT